MVVLSLLQVVTAYTSAICTPPAVCTAAPCNRGVSMKCNGRWICTQTVNKYQLDTAGVINNFVEKTYTCSDIRAKGERINFNDSGNTTWRVDWGVHVTSMCFPGGDEIYFKAGGITKRQRFEDPKMICCEFSKVRDGWGRDDFTKVCCKGYAGPQPRNSCDFPNKFARFIKQHNNAARRARAQEQALLAAQNAQSATEGSGR